jgi:hypothetical protein
MERQNIEMKENVTVTPTSRIKILLFIIIFIGTAAWGGYVLAKNAHLMKDVNEIIKFYKQLQDRGLRADALDDKGRTALHHAIRS